VSSSIVSIGVGGFEVRIVDGDPRCCMRGSEVSNVWVLAIIGGEIWSEAVYGRGLTGKPGLKSGVARRVMVGETLGAIV